MFKKFCLYAAAFIAIAVYVLALNETFMRFYTNKIMFSDNKNFRNDNYRYGDLYAMSYLKDYKFPLSNFTDSLHRQTDTAKNTDLWLIGDSFLSVVTSEIVDSVLYKTSLKYFYYPNTENGRKVNITLSGNRKKILLIERTERFMRMEFTERKEAIKYLNFFQTDTLNPVAGPAIIHDKIPVIQENKSNNLSFLKNLKLKWNSPEIVNQNLEKILFGYGLFTPFKEIKAGINYRIFNRVNPLVYPSPDKKNLYFYETIDPESTLSSFNPVAADEVAAIVSNINFVAEEYKKKGFDEVIFSIIPNAVTIDDPGIGKYNNLINKIQNNDGLRVPVIDIFSVFQKVNNPKSLYRKSDTHWNAKGFSLWIDNVNIFLKEFAE